MPVFDKFFPEVLEIDTEDLSDADDRFARLSFVQQGDKLSRHAGLIKQTKEEVFSAIRPVVAWRIFDVASVMSDRISLTNGSELCGSELAVLIKGCDHALLYVCSVGRLSYRKEIGFDMLKEFFVDSWGSAYLESLSAYFINNIKVMLEAENMEMFKTIETGTDGFPISNRKIVFDLIPAEEINVELTENMMMRPEKTICAVAPIKKNGIINIVKQRIFKS